MKELKCTLKTKRYSDAMTLAGAQLAKTERLFSQMRSGLMTGEEIRELVRKYFERSSAETEEDRAVSGAGVLEGDEEGEHGGASSADGLELHLLDLREDLARGHYEKVEHIVKDILSGAGITLSPDSAQYKVLRRETLKAVIEGTRIELGRMLGDYGASSLGLSSGLSSEPSSSPTATPQMPLSKLLAEYLSEYSQSGKWRSRTKTEAERAFKLIERLLGGDRDIRTLDRKALISFRDALTRWPSNVNKMPQYRGKTTEEILSMNIGRDKALSIPSVNKHLVYAQAFLKWAMALGYITINPAEGLKIRQKRKASEGRNVFTLEELEKLVAALARFRESDKPERYWIPLIALYSGMRLGEIAQMYVGDVREEGGITFFDVNEETPDKPLKNISSRRRVPVHPVLLKLGLLGYVKQRSSQASNSNTLWALERKLDSRSQDFSKWFGRFNRKLITKDRKKTFHSFRHTFINNLKQQQVDLNVLQELVGHSSGSITLERYGKGYSLEILLETLKKVRYGVSVEP